MKIYLKDFVKKILPREVWNFLRHYQDIIHDWIVNKGVSTCSIDYCGFQLCYSPGTILINKIRHGRVFEEKMCRSIVVELNKSSEPIFLDVGSNIGLISLYVVAMIPEVSIYAFEPGPHQNEFLNKTIVKNHLDRKIILSDMALGNKDGTITFISHFSPDCSGDGFIDTGRAGAPIPVPVSVTTIDHWWRKNGQPNIGVMKIDIEGAELWALEGAVDFIEKVHPVIFLEIEPKNIQVYPYTRDDILKWFINHNYGIYTLDNHLCTLENWDSFIGQYDTYIARPISGSLKK